MRKESIQSQCESGNSALITMLFQHRCFPLEHSSDKCHFVPMPQCSFASLQSKWFQPNLMKAFRKKEILRQIRLLAFFFISSESLSLICQGSDQRQVKLQLNVIKLKGLYRLFMWSYGIWGVFSAAFKRGLEDQIYHCDSFEKLTLRCTMEQHPLISSNCYYGRPSSYPDKDHDQSSLLCLACGWNLEWPNVKWFEFKSN